MASTSNDQTQQGPSLITSHHPESSGSVHNTKSERNPSIPIPPTDLANPPQPTPSNLPPPNTPKPLIPPNPPTPDNNHPVQHRFLTPTEWARVAHGLGAIREGAEEHQVAHPTCWYWPPRGMPGGLYREVVGQRAKYGAGFQALSALRWALLVLQVVVGAALTALGSLALRQAALVTALAAVSTVGAGVVGLMHNSGLPDRYRMDRAQFVQVEDFIREVLDTGIVEAEQRVEDILNECFTRFANARATVISNKPEVYSGSPPPAGKPNVTPPSGAIGASSLALNAATEAERPQTTPFFHQQWDEH
ncbi:uncharacterized protein B0H64DRAFT_433263 [Chaetomium fimeti]|uniref:SMODS and SLOG-associating 2TM effector domain-containing protein n=1 Tax=Chaetomium fimeti TaxID=1854472 RepID=A0AAE0LQQ5_9PEZI|nr:hypothetical protein B0H64DRAFT_433263 [Chaetomium fimeti]